MNIDTASLPNLETFFQKALEWQPNQQQQKQFQQLYTEIILGNKQLNLTRITEPTEFVEKHLWDSLVCLFDVSSIPKLQANQPLKVIDIGTGAGFPGIPIAITFPLWTVTLLDATRKKIDFLEILLQKLKINNLQTLIGRAEEIGQNSQHRESYDIALIRAVAEPSVCAEYALPLLKVGGIAILYRGHWCEDNTLNLQPVLNQLGGKISLIKELQTPLSYGLRNWIYLQKTTPTSSQFPRLAGIPKQKPLL